MGKKPKVLYYFKQHSGQPTLGWVLVWGPSDSCRCELSQLQGSSELAALPDGTFILTFQSLLPALPVWVSWPLQWWFSIPIWLSLLFLGFQNAYRDHLYWEFSNSGFGIPPHPLAWFSKCFAVCLWHIHCLGKQVVLSLIKLDFVSVCSKFMAESSFSWCLRALIVNR